MHVPHHGFADRVALIANDRAFGHLHPLALDRNPIGATANVVGGAMSVRLIAAGHAVRRDHALEPGADIRRHMAELAPVDGERRAGQHRKKSDQNELRKPPHPILRHVALVLASMRPTNRIEDNSTGLRLRMRAQIICDGAVPDLMRCEIGTAGSSIVPN